MINFNGMEKQKFAMINDILNTKMLGKELVISVIMKNADWVVNWAWFANELKSSKKSIHIWMKKAAEIGIWEVDKNNNIKFLPEFFKSVNFTQMEKFTQKENFTQEKKSVNFSQKSVNFTQMEKFTHNKEQIGLNLKFTKKHQKEQECVRAKINDLQDFKQDSENVALSSQDLDNFADDLSENQREFDKTSELQCAGSENLTQINFYNDGEARQNETKTHSTAQNSTAVALGLQKIAFISTQKAPQMSISEAFARYQDKNFSVCGGENLTQINFCESGEARQNTQQKTQNAEQNERDFTDSEAKAQNSVAELNSEAQNTAQNAETNAQVDISKMEKATQNTEQTQNETLKAQKTAKKAQKSPESVAAELFNKNAEFAAQANFSEGEKSAVLDYFAYKAEHKRHPLTERVAKATLKQCIKIKAQNKDLIDIIERTIANNWADLRWLADKPKNAWQAQQDERKAKDDEILANYLKRKNAAQKAV